MRYTPQDFGAMDCLFSVNGEVQAGPGLIASGNVNLADVG